MCAVTVEGGYCRDLPNAELDSQLRGSTPRSPRQIVVGSCLLPKWTRKRNEASDRYLSCTRLTLQRFLLIVCSFVSVIAPTGYLPCLGRKEQ